VKPPVITHTDLSAEEPTGRADPVITAERESGAASAPDHDGPHKDMGDVGSSPDV